MNRKFLVSVVAVFVVAMLLGFLIHGLTLGGAYAKLPIMRSESASQQLFGLMILAHVIYAIGFAWIYMRGREAAKPWLGQGVRFGLAVALVAVIPVYLIYYVVMPFPADLVVQQVVFDTLGTILLGIVVAWINR